MITSSTPYGKPEDGLNALRLYLTLGVSFVASAMSSKIKELAKLIQEGMNYPGFAVVHVQSPCTVYNDTYEQLKGNVKKGIEPLAWDIDEGHDPSDLEAANNVINKGGVPMGVIYRAPGRVPFDIRIREMASKAQQKSVEDIVNSYAF